MYNMFLMISVQFFLLIKVILSQISFICNRKSMDNFEKSYIVMFYMTVKYVKYVYLELSLRNS